MLLVDAEGEVETAAGEDEGCGCEEDEGMLAVGGQFGVCRMLGWSTTYSLDCTGSCGVTTVLESDSSISADVLSMRTCSAIVKLEITRGCVELLWTKS